MDSLSTAFRTMIYSIFVVITTGYYPTHLKKVERKAPELNFLPDLIFRTGVILESPPLPGSSKLEVVGFPSLVNEYRLAAPWRKAWSAIRFLSIGRSSTHPWIHNDVGTYVTCFKRFPCEDMSTSIYWLAQFSEPL